jgi:hypothetical protein
LHGPEHRAIRSLVALVEDVIIQLESPTGEAALLGIVPECNAALEACLERLRDVAERDDRMRTATDDLRRLNRLLKLVDAADIPFIMRQLRRVLGRFDAAAGSVFEDRRGSAR